VLGIKEKTILQKQLVKRRGVSRGLTTQKGGGTTTNDIQRETEGEGGNL